MPEFGPEQARKDWEKKKDVEDMKHDPWAHRSTGMVCASCMWFCNMRCRRHAPTMSGYPAVYPSDWCGDHKIDKARMGGM
jgi:hypothetical protein